MTALHGGWSPAGFGPDFGISMRETVISTPLFAACFIVERLDVGQDISFAPWTVTKAVHGTVPSAKGQQAAWTSRRI
eukprot:2125956-Amphidinium_carterae.1